MAVGAESWNRRDGLEVRRPTVHVPSGSRRINLANAVIRCRPSIRPFDARRRAGADDGIATSCTAGSVAAESDPRNSCSARQDRSCSRFDIRLIRYRFSVPIQRRRGRMPRHISALCERTSTGTGRPPPAPRRTDSDGLKACPIQFDGHVRLDSRLCVLPDNTGPTEFYCVVCQRRQGFVLDDVAVVKQRRLQP